MERRAGKWTSTSKKRITNSRIFFFYYYSLLSFCLFFWLFFSWLYNTSFPIAQKRLTARSREEEHEIRLHAQDISFSVFSFFFSGQNGGVISLSLLCVCIQVKFFFFLLLLLLLLALLAGCCWCVSPPLWNTQHTKKIERRRTGRKWKGGHEHNIQKKKKKKATRQAFISQSTS